jgi:hypothetical protein
MPRDRKQEKKEEQEKVPLHKEYEQAKVLEGKAEALYKNIAKQKGKDDLADDTRFEMYKDVGGDRMYRRMEGGSVAQTFTQDEMESFVGKYEDQFNMQFEDNALAGEESRSTARIKNRKSMVNSGQQTVPLSATDFVGTDGFVPESFTVVENGMPVTRTFLIR